MGMTDIEIREWLHSMEIYDYDLCDGIIGPNNVETTIVHVVGDVNLYGRGLLCIPFQFGYVSGNFICFGNNLVSLEGCPTEVGGFFDCHSNKLTSLEGFPSEVGGDFICSHNKLISLECGPEVVGGYFYCYDNLFKCKPDTSHIKIGGEFVWE
jgi:hypothetical protein